MPSTFIHTLLIANRGEIACRIIQTCKKLNIKTVAVYAEHDITAQHVKMADTAHCVGTNKLQDSYLNIDKIIAVAKKENVDAIHPGYGFLSENAVFAQRCQEENIIFIGPSSEAIQLMASKDEAKKIMQAAGVPIIPGKLDLSDDAQIGEECLTIGLPVILKAANGGGGKGMRIVRQIDALEDAIRQAKQEAKNAFGDDTLFVEKFLTQARHIEVQIFRDTHGNAMHLFERDCSTQRRHQKIIEETPAVNIPADIKQRMYQSAILAAEQINYTGAGTIEFLYTPDGAYYFMEMNTRLQVEHPVTEMTTGLDLVEWQIRIAQGEALPLAQKDIIQRGHAIEARIYAEDPAQHFLPQTGTIQHIFTKNLPNTRLDIGVQQGDKISIFFDPLLCKAVAWGKTREQAIRVLHQYLTDFQLVGLKTNIPFLQTVLQSESFAKGMDVQHLSHHLAEYLSEEITLDLLVTSIAALLCVLKRETANQQSTPSPWTQISAFRVNLPCEERLTLKIEQHSIPLKIEHLKNSQASVSTIPTASLRVTEATAPDKSLVIEGRIEHDLLYYHVDSVWHAVPYFTRDNEIYFLRNGCLYHFTRNMDTNSTAQIAQHDSHILLSPMPGMITKIWKQSGDTVTVGEKLIALEAMKMEHTLQAPKSGTIKCVYFNAGDQVQEGASLLEYHE